MITNRYHLYLFISVKLNMVFVFTPPPYKKKSPNSFDFSLANVHENNISSVGYPTVSKCKQGCSWIFDLTTKTRTRTWTRSLAGTVPRFPSAGLTHVGGVLTQGFIRLIPVHQPVSTLHHRGHAPLTHIVQGAVSIRIGVRPQGIIRALGSPTPLGLGDLEHTGTFVPVVHHLFPQPVPLTLGGVHRSVLVAGNEVGCVQFVWVPVDPVRQAATARVVDVARLAGARTDLLPVVACTGKKNSQMYSINPLISYMILVHIFLYRCNNYN